MKANPSTVPFAGREQAEIVTARLAAIVEFSHDAIIGKDMKSIITSWNKGAEKIFGYTADEMVGTSIMRLIPDDRHDEENHILAKIGRGETVEHFETRRLTKDGRLIDVSVRASPIKDAAGTVIGVSKVARDITARQHEEEMLHKASRRATGLKRNRILWELAVILVLGVLTVAILDYTDLLVAPLDRIALAFKGDLDDLIGPLLVLLLGFFIFAYRRWKDVQSQVGEQANIEEALRKLHDELEKRIQVRTVELIEANEALQREIAERKHAELLTAVQHAVTEVLAEASPLPETMHRILEIICRRLTWDLGDLWTVDRTTKTLRCVDIWHPPSTEFRAFADASRALAFAPGEGLPGRVWNTREPQWIADVSQAEFFLRRRQAAEIGLRGALAFPIKLRNEIFGVMEIFSIRSRPPEAEILAMFAALGTQIGQFIERKQIEDQLRQTQKMEAIGTLAGGIAHDFNNILGAIIGYAELTKIRVKDNPTACGYLDAVLQGGKRASTLVRQILSFSRQEQVHRQLVQLSKVVAEPVQLLRATIPATIQFEVSLASDLPPVLADSSQIHQIVMNLCTNAAHAMRDRPGRLGVRLENFTVDALLAAANPGLQPGPYVRLSVSDTGHGMSATTQARIFEPFFTTKGPGEGTGLGLSVVHGIMQNHHGIITVYSQPGEGTVFHLYFPAATQDAATPLAELAAAPTGHGERILFVDDEAPLALLGQKMLEELGYAVESKTSVAEALALVRSNPSAFALVITDLTMPLMTGTDFAQELLKIRPGLPVILATGYTANLNDRRVREIGIRELLLKPLTLESLGAAVHRTLAGQATK